MWVPQSDLAAAIFSWFRGQWPTTMPRYFFDIEHRGCRVTDDLGMELDDVGTAWREAIFLLEVLALEMRVIAGASTIRVRIRDEANASLHEIRLGGDPG